MDGYMLLTERLRDEDEKAIVQSIFVHITLTGFGSHDLVVETPEHSMTLACMPKSSILHVLLAYKLRVQ